MTAIHVEITADDIAAADEVRPDAWCIPVERALARLTGQDVSIDGDGLAGIGTIATIGQGSWTLVVDLPLHVNRWLNDRFEGDLGDREASKPFAFDLPVPEWIVALVESRGHRLAGAPR